MTSTRLIITAVVVEGRSQGEVARAYGVSKGWVSKLMTRYRLEGEAAFEPRSRAPKNHPHAVPEATVAVILDIRARLATQGLDAGAETIAWHLKRQGHPVPARSTIHRLLVIHEHVRPEPKKKPKSAYHRFAADQPNECWQSDFTHYRLTTGVDTEIITWLDDHSRYALHVTAHPRITGDRVLSTFRAVYGHYGLPASVLTDNGMVYTVKHSAIGVRDGRNAFEVELARLGVVQKNGRGNHPQTQGKVCEDLPVVLHRPGLTPAKV